MLEKCFKYHHALPDVVLVVHYFYFLGGFLANSLAIATDAAHLLTDFASFLISLLSLLVAARPATKRMSFGWYRAGEG